MWPSGRGGGPWSVSSRTCSWIPEVSATPSSTSAIGGTRRAHFRSSTAEFRFEEATRFVDPEGGAPVLADPSMVASRYLAAWRRHRSALASIALAADVDLRETFLDQDIASGVAAYLLARAGKGGRR